MVAPKKPKDHTNLEHRRMMMQFNTHKNKTK